MQLARPGGKRIRQSLKTKKKREAQKRAEELAGRLRKENDSDLAATFQNLMRRACEDASDGELNLDRLEQLLRKAHSGANPDYKRPSLKEHLAAWVEGESSRVSLSTRNCYRQVSEKMLQALGQAAATGPIDKLTTPQVQKALAQINRAVSDSYSNLILRTFRRMMEAAVAQGLIATNPAGTHIKPFKEQDSIKRLPFSKQEFGKLLTAARKHSEEWEGVVLIGGHTGLRLSDILALQADNVADGKITVKTAKTGTVLTIPVTPPVHSWLEGKTEGLFPLLSTKAPGTVSSQFNALMAKAGVPKKSTSPAGEPGTRSFHSLRHSFASWLAEADVHADVRKKLTGHHSDGIHARYTHHDKALKSAIATLPEIAG